VKYRSVDELGAEDVGRRVTVRRRLSEGGYSDVIGVLEHADKTSVTVRDRNGHRHTIERTDIAAARVVRSPAPLRKPQNPAPG
jgi:ribosome maturation factor RimP